MSTILDSYPAEDLGERLRIARDDRKMTQAVAASEAGMARTTLVAIEKGQRRIRLDELQTLAGIYCKTINELLRQQPIHINLLPQFRKLSESEDAPVEQAVELLNDLVRAEVELEQLLGISRSFVYPPRPLSFRATSNFKRNKTRSTCANGLGLASIQSTTL